MIRASPTAAKTPAAQGPRRRDHRDPFRGRPPFVSETSMVPFLRRLLFTTARTSTWSIPHQVGSRVPSRRAPVSFHPVIAHPTPGPVTRHPDEPTVGRNRPMARDPDIAPQHWPPAPLSGGPCVLRARRRRRRFRLSRRLWRQGGGAEHGR